MSSHSPLIKELDLLTDGQKEDFISLVKNRIGAYKGLSPSSIYFGNVRSRRYDNSYKYDEGLIIRWDMPSLSSDIVLSLDDLTVEMYAPKFVQTIRNPPGASVSPSPFTPAVQSAISKSRSYGFSSKNRDNFGLYLGRMFRSDDDARKILKRVGRAEWLHEGSTFVELRLSSQSSIMFDSLEFATRVGATLGGNLDYSSESMVYDLYKSLMLQRIDETSEEELASLEDALDFMRWTIFGGSMSGVAGDYYGIVNQSVLLAGVYGVG